ncbi:MAG: energy-coupling factor transporter ATPase [Ruminococcaceae bacterium]|nr:energy-coupling factor transporter ATPase [Oscillospiraceae bacterium]
MAFIEVKNLSYAYGGEGDSPVYALNNLSFEIEKGEYVAILGHNGSGKSTFAKLLTMVIDDYDYLSGNIYVDGVDILSEDISEDEIFELRKRVGMVFQNPDNQLVATVVEEDVAFGPENLGIERSEIRRRVDEALQTVGMTKYAKHEPHRLSGGQKQRVAIAGIIAMMPECMIFDESTAMLDPMGRREVISTVEKLNRESGITTINITHYMDEAARADRIIVFNNGSVILKGTPKEVFAQSEIMRAAGLDLPQCIDLAEKLKKNGVALKGDITNPYQCAEAVAAALKDK